MSQLFGTGPVPQNVIPPPSPSRTDPEIQKAGDATLQSVARQGAASQFLTRSVFSKNDTTSRQQYLGGL